MEKKPQTQYLETKKATCWTNDFDTFSVTVCVPDNEYRTDVLNYGYLAPYLLVFAPQRFSFEEACDFAEERGFFKLASKYATSVVFVYPASGDWNTASPDIFADIITESRIHQYYEDGIVTAHNRFSGQLEGYFIRGALFRTCLYGYGVSADYIGRCLIKHFEGNWLWGKADSAPVVCVLNGLGTTPKIEASDIPIISVGNSEEINAYIKANANYTYFKDNEDIFDDYERFARPFKRMLKTLDIEENPEKDGLITEPGIELLTTSGDNEGDDKGSEKHNVGYFAYYEKDALKNGPVPLLLCFHGGGDSANYIAYMSGWVRIALRHKFLLVSIENHLNSTATEMIELIDILKKKYPIDETRIYVSGFSMGGCKSWDMIQEYPRILAAAAPMDATFEVGLNVFGKGAPCEINRTVPVPVFYAGGELTPLPELPFQAQKCLDRTAYMFELNDIKKKYEVKLEEASEWENPIWGINGDKKYMTKDRDREGILTIQLFESRNGKCYSAFASISNQGHEAREHTCENAWRFMSCFRRMQDGSIDGGDINTIYNCFTY